MTPGRDYGKLACELVRALRGRRSQVALSRRLGYRTNVCYLWESGRRSPSASELFRIVERTGGSIAPAWSLFRQEPRGDLRDPAALPGWLEGIRGSARVSDLARRAGVSRFVASRWLAGRTEPRLSDLLALVDILTLRLVDFVDAFVPVAEVASLRDEARQLAARRAVAFEHPWSVAILRVIETTAYRRARRHRSAPIAALLGISTAEVDATFAALEAAGVVEREGARYASTPIAVDTSTASLDARRALRRHWADVGRERLLTDDGGLFSWTVFAVSRSDLERLRALHVAYMTSLRQLVDASAPSEVVAVANVQLFELSDATSR